jgi:glutamate dehydrogenase (NAD(P)+)
MDEYSKFNGFHPGVVTGKPIELFGSVGREEATGRGVLIATEEYLATQCKKVADSTFVIQGFGNVGSHAARLISTVGGTVVGIGDHTGSFYDPSGIDIPAALAWVRERRSLAGFPAPTVPKDTLLMQRCDVLIPAALGGVITHENAKELACSLIVEGANGPTTPEADEILRGREIAVLPDIFANAGGVTVSYFEWVQNVQQFPWDEARVRAELERLMRAAFGRIVDVARSRHVDFRTAAFVVAIERVARATAMRGL